MYMHVHIHYLGIKFDASIVLSLLKVAVWADNFNLFYLVYLVNTTITTTSQTAHQFCRASIIALLNVRLRHDVSAIST